MERTSREKSQREAILVKGERNPGLLGEVFVCRFPETAKGYSNDNSLSGKGEHCGFSICCLNDSVKAAQRESGLCVSMLAMQLPTQRCPRWSQEHSA